METVFLLFALLMSEAKNKELEKRIEGFERMTKSLSDEVDRQSRDFPKPKGKSENPNSFPRAA